MASTRKSRTITKKLSKVNEESPEKDEGKSRQKKRKLSDMLGSQWSKEELERFYDAYRKYGKDWKKVAGVVRNRSIDMVEALYNMNRAYLSLPEGTASVVGLIAMMTDHYNILEGSESERESNDGPGISRKPQKRGRGKSRANISKGLDDHVPDLLQHTPPVPALALLRKKRTGGSRPRAVGKRTPRFPVSHSYGGSPNKQGRKAEVDTNDDEVAAFVLAQALHRGGSPKDSQTPKRRTELMRVSPFRNGERRRSGSELASAKLVGTAVDEDYIEGSLGSREAENGDFVRDTSYMMDTDGVGTVEVQRKGKKLHRKKPKFQSTENDSFDDVREACSGTEEGLQANSVKAKVEDEVTDAKAGKSSPMGSRKRSRQLFYRDESPGLDALCTLADLSMKLAPESAVDSESSVQFKEENVTVEEKPGVPRGMSTNHPSNKLKVMEAKERGDHTTPGVHVNPLKRKRKLIPGKITRSEALIEPPLNESRKTEVPVEEGKKSMSKSKRSGQISPLQKQGKSARPPERSSSSTDPLRMGTDSFASVAQVPHPNQVNLPTKLRSRRKKAFIRKELKSPEDFANDRLNSLPNGALDLKQKLSRSLSSQMLRRWCAFEWFYSAIDYPWFVRNEFVEYLTHVGLGHVTRLTRVEWSVVRSSLGRPRRFCQQFLLEEKKKLETYRESVRTHYTELRAGIREGLPTDLPQPLSVGQHVTACHPKTRELHDGSVLTVDRNKCRVQFDRPELGVEFVMDVDCTPLNPLEHLPEALRRQKLAASRLRENFGDMKLNGRSKDWKFEGSMGVTPSENQDNQDGMSLSLPTHPMNTLLKQAKVDTISAISQAKAAASEIFNAQKAAYTHPCTLAQIQAREADIRALSELGRALDKKEMLVLELRHMNDEVLEKQKLGDNTLKDSEPFKKQYAMLLVQLKEANDQVSAALLYLRQRNTYQENSPPPWLKSGASSGSLVRPPTPFDQATFLPQESGSRVRVVEIVETSKQRAQTMVDAAVQAMSSLKEGEDAFIRVGEALDSATNRQHGPDSDTSTMPPTVSTDLGQVNSAIPNGQNSHTLESIPKACATGPNATTASDRSEVQIPSELISSCIATMLMIQTCTERQYPPAEVAQILDSAVSNLQPFCSQNLPIYREIQMCMGLVKNQILALIPT